LVRSNIQEWKDSHKEKEQGWFDKTVRTTAAILGTSAAIFGAFKMKGPFRKLLEYYQVKDMDRYFDKATQKYDFRPMDAAAKWNTAYSSVIKKTISNFRAEVKGSWDYLSTSPSLKNNIKAKESQIVSTFIELLERNSAPSNTNTQLSEKEFSSTFNKEVAEDALALARQRAIFRWIQEYDYTGSLSYTQAEADMEFYNSPGYMSGKALKDPTKRAVITRTNKETESLLDDQRFAALYHEELIPIARKAQQLLSHIGMLIKSHDPKILSPFKVTSYFYGSMNANQQEHNKFSQDILRSEDTLLATKDEGIFKDRVNGLTSGGRRPQNGRSELLNKVGSVEYTSYITRIINVLNGALTENVGLKDYRISVQSYDFSSGEKRYLLFEFFHESRDRPILFRIPIATNGQIPSSVPIGQTKAAKGFIVGDVFGAREFGDPKNQFVSASQLVLSKLADAFEGAAFSGLKSFRDDPDHISKVVSRIVDSVHSQLAPITGSLRDIVQELGVTPLEVAQIVNPGPHVSAHYKQNLNNFVLNSHHMNRMKHATQKTVTITIDLESLSNGTEGPEFAATDLGTQFVKAGLVVTDMHGAHPVLYADELTSRHGFDHFNSKGNYWSESLMGWLRDHVVPGGGKYKGNDIVQGYSDHLKAIGARKDIKGNRQFFDELRKMISAQTRKYESQGYNVVYLTKNGTYFDLRAMDLWTSPEFMKTIRDRHIDVQATAGALKRAFFEQGSLRQERMLQFMLTKMGLKESDPLVTALTRGHDIGDLTKIMSQIMVKLRKPTAGFGPSFSLLTLSDEQIRDFGGKKKQWLSDMHQSPVLDALFTSAIFNMQMHAYSTNPEIGQAASQLERWLGTNSATRGALNLFDVAKRMESQVIPGYGVMSFSAASHGMIHGLTASFADLYSMQAFCDNPANKQFNQRFAQEWTVKPSVKWMTAHGNPKVTDLEYKKIFNSFIRTDFAEEASRMHLPQAGDAQAVFTKTVMARGIYTMDPTAMGSEAGKQFIRQSCMDNFALTKSETIHLNGVVGEDAILHNQLHNFRKAVWVKLHSKYGKDKTEFTAAEWKLAEKEAWGNGMYIDVTEKILSSFALGGGVHISKRNVQGRLMSIINQGSPMAEKLTATIQLELSGRAAGDLVIQSRLEGSRSNLQVVADDVSGANAHNIPNGFDFVADGNFIRKGYIGSAKEIFFGNIMHNAMEKYNKMKDPKKKELFKIYLQKMAQKYGATADPGNYSLTFKRINPGEVDRVARYLGNIDMRLADLTQFARRTGMVWKKGENMEFNAGQRNALSVYQRDIKEHIKNMEQEIRSNKGCLEGLTQLQSGRAIAEAKDLLGILSPENKHAKLFKFINGGGEKGSHSLWQVGFESWSAMSIYGISSTGGKFEANFRLDYMAALENSGGTINKSSIDWLRKHVTHARDHAAASALNTYQRYQDAIFGKMNMRNPMSVNDFNRFINRDQAIQNLRKKYLSHMSGKSLGDVQAEIESLLQKAQEMNDVDKSAVHMQEIEDLRDLLHSNKREEFLGSLSRSARVYSQEEVTEFSKVAFKNKGLINLKLPGGARVWEMNIDQELRRMGGQLIGDKSLGKREMVERFETFKMALVAAQKENPGKKQMFEVEGNKLRLNKSLVLDLDPHSANVFNRLAPNVLLSGAELEIKLGIMRNLAKLNTAKGKAKEEIGSQFNRDVIRMIMIGFGANKNSKLWEAAQYKPPGMFKAHYGIEQIILNAKNTLSELNNKNPKLNFQIGNGLASNTMGQIINSEMNTVLISESQFKSHHYTELDERRKHVIKNTGVEINYSRQLENALRNDKGKFQEVIKGQRVLPGGMMYRYPVPQAGGHPLMDINYLVIPDDIAKHLGMNPNSFYAHTVMSMLQGSDNDGDYAVLHFKEIHSLQEMNKMHRENQRVMQNIMDSSELSNLVKSQAIHTDSAGRVDRKVKLGAVHKLVGFNTEGVVVQSYEFSGGVNSRITSRTRTVKKELIDSSEAVSQLVKLAAGLANHSPEAMEMSEFIVGEGVRSQLPALSKQLIPNATNLLKRMNAGILTASEAGRLNGSVTAHELFGSINHGLAGIIGQLPLELGKHIDPKKLGEAVIAYDFWSNPEANTKFRKQVFTHFKSFYSNWADPPSQEHITEHFKTLEDIAISINRLKKTPGGRLFDAAANDIVMGRKNSSIWSLAAANGGYEFEEASERQKGPFELMKNAFKDRLRISPETLDLFKKSGKAGAIGASLLLGLSMFHPFGTSKSLNPLDYFVDVGPDIKSNNNLFRSDLELPEPNPLDMVNASFSKQAFVRMNDQGRNNDRQRGSIVGSMLRDAGLMQPYAQYDVRSQPNVNFSNYTTSVPHMGSPDLARRSQL